ncbi:GntR family transcriptional regulator [Pandoraea pulmonicola]|uniref:GntR family transcriptional regulator n=1 Tax=Pandoraea pulmonicola TaxID=93221 RepID=A0AAJ4ZAG6_PANPU|nr:GntR family transcriptional regulator [Pandoraea pulmonicola]APD13377.1 GntR family transcriptional regulator [Pandoraea pulmonicola]SUA89611.1 HTH-type transcriptional regulator mcbR [Pandoraea pulmonicola]
MPETFLQSVEPLEPRASLGEAAYLRLKDSIMQGEFPANRKMTLRAVATALGVSTTPARDAINRLLAEGALVNEGPRTVVLPALTLDALEEVTQTRLALEGLATEQAAPKITPADLAEMERLQTLIDKGLDRRRYDQVLKANREFHFTVYKRSGWPRLVSMIESLWLRAGPSLLDLYPEFREHRKGVSNHLALMKALKQKDAARARAAMEQDLKDGYERLKCAIEERERRIHGEEPLAQY